MQRAIIAFYICLFMAALIVVPFVLFYALEHSPSWAINTALALLLAATIWGLAGNIAGNR